MEKISRAKLKEVKSLSSELQLGSHREGTCKLRQGEPWNPGLGSVSRGTDTDVDIFEHLQLEFKIGAFMLFQTFLNHANSIQNSVQGLEGAALRKLSTPSLLFQPRNEILLYRCLAYSS